MERRLGTSVSYTNPIVERRLGSTIMYENPVRREIIYPKIKSYLSNRNIEIKNSPIVNCCKCCSTEQTYEYGSYYAQDRLRCQNCNKVCLIPSHESMKRGRTSAIPEKMSVKNSFNYEPRVRSIRKSYETRNPESTPYTTNK